MKKLFLSICLIFVFQTPGYAISETEFQKLYKSSPALQKADQLLNKTWEEVSNNIPKRSKRSLLALQREWVKSGRDESADEYLQEGYNKGCAYAIATIRWVKNLRVFEYNYNLSEEDQGSAKADDAFWDEEEDIPKECRKK